MKKILIKESKHLPGGWIYEVRVIEDDEESFHEVELTKADYQDLSGAQLLPKELVEKCFEFLLARQEKENILEQFNLTEIGIHFPEFNQEIQEMIS